MSDLIVSNPDIRDGEYVIAGTRFPVWEIHDMRDDGWTVQHMIDAYPALAGQERGIAAALAFPSRREVTAFADPDTGTALEVRERWTPGEVEIVPWIDAMWDATVTVRYEHIPALIAALQAALTWNEEPSR